MNNMTSSVSLESTTKDIERDCAYGGLFQQIINEMKNSAPLWEDLTTKSAKLHSCLRATIQAVSAFLDAFQKIADVATSTKGATKDIGTSLTRICMRHKALEVKMKTFASSILDCLIIPLQERMEDWKKTTTHLDKEHAKEYKRARAELKKRSMETMRLQKKVRKGGLNNGGMSGSFAGTLPRSGGSGIVAGMNTNGGDSMGYNHQGLAGGNRDATRILEAALRDVTEKRHAFEDAEKQAIRSALIEERSRFCLFVSFLKPVVDEEVAMLSELTHVQEAMQQLEKQASDPFALPPASEQVIADLKGSCDSGTWSFQTPPSSPSSLGSRKSSTCSISSANSSSSGSAHSPLHNLHNRTILHQPMACHPGGTLRYSILSSQDSGFTSQDTLFSRMPARFYDQCKVGNPSEGSNTSSTASSNSSTPSSPYPPGPGTGTSNATWPNLQDSIQFERAACAIMNERPHTISSAYERGHQRPPLTVHTFQPPSDSSSHPASPSATPVTTPIIDPHTHIPGGPIYQSTSEIYGTTRGKNDSKPPVPKRCSSLERPNLTSSGSNYEVPPKQPPKGRKDSKDQKRDSVSSLNKPIPAVPDFNQSSPDMIIPQPLYVNMQELNEMASMKHHRQQQRQAAERQQYQQPQVDLPPPPPELMAPSSKMAGMENNLKCDGSLASSGYGSQNPITVGEERGPSSGTIGSSQVDGEVCGVVNSSTDLQRNSGDHEKPLPPVRKTSSISVPNSSVPASPIPGHQLQQQIPQYSHQMHHCQNNTASGSNEQYNINSSKFCSTGSSSQGSLATDSSDVTPHASMEHLPPPPESMEYDPRRQDGENAYLANLCPEQRNLLNSDDPAVKRMSVAETIKTLTEKRHQPLSPNMIRRSQSMRQPGDEKESMCSQSKTSNSNWNNRRAASTASNSLTKSHSLNKDAERTNLMQVLNQQLSQVHQPTYGNLGHPSHHQQQHQSSQQQPQYHPNSQQQTQYHPGFQQHPPQPHPKPHTNSQQQQYVYTQQQQQFTNSQQHQHIGSPPGQYRQVSIHQNPSQQHSPLNYQPTSPPHYQQNSPPNCQNPAPNVQHGTQPIYQQIVRVQSISQSANNSPRHPRRFSEELLKTTATFVQNRVLGNKTPPPVVTSKEIFVQTLNAKLSQMRVSSPPTDKKHLGNNTSTKTSFASKLAASVSHHSKGNSVGEMTAAFRVRQWISSKTVSDPSIIRESLMDQIRRGTRLRQTRTVNDRSAPRMN